MRNVLILTFALIFQSFFAHSQVDSLQYYLDVGLKYQRQGLFEQAAEQYLLSLQYPTDSVGLLSVVYQELSLSSNYSRHRDSSVSWAKKSLQIADQIQDQKRMMDAYDVLGSAYYNKSKYDSAITAYFNALKLASDLGLENGVLYENIGRIYEIKGDDSLALQYNLKSLKLARQESDTSAISAILRSIGILYVNLGDLERSIKIMDESISIARQYNDIFNIAVSTLNQGINYQDYDWAKSIPYLEESAMTFDSINDLNGAVYALSNLGLSHAFLGNRSRAELYLDSARSMAERLGYQETVMVVLKEQIKTDSLFGNYKEALEHHVEYAEMASELSKNEKVQEIDLAKTAFDFSLQEKEKQLLESKLAAQEAMTERRNSLLVFAVIIILGIAAFGVYWYRQNQIRRRKNEHIEMLMRELHHRVKNNLQVISSLLGLQSMKLENVAARQAVTEGKNRVKAMSMIHQRLYQNEDISVIAFKAYVEELVADLKQSYMPERNVEFMIEVPDVRMTADKTLPLGLIINELVSNSFKYAFKETVQPKVAISLKISDDVCLMQVSDNGPGIADDLMINPSTFGLSLVNILSEQLKAQLISSSTNGQSYQLKFAA